MSPMSSTDFFPSRLALLSTLQSILAEWEVQLFDKPSIALPALARNIDELKKGLVWFQPSSDASPAEIEIEGQSIRTSPHERSIILRLSKILPINKPACHALLKYFVVSEHCHKDWKEYLGSVDATNMEIESRILTKFLRYYFDERVASLELLLIVFQCSWNESHPCKVACNDILHSLYTQPSDFLGKLVDQLLDEVIKQTASSYFSYQHFREQRALLAVILLMTGKDYSLGEAHSIKFFNWLFSGNKAEFVNLHPAAKSEKLHSDRLKLGLFYRLLKIDGLDNSDHMVQSSPQVFDTLFRNALTSPPSPDNTMYYMALALIAKAAIVHHGGEPPEEASHKQLYDVLIEPNFSLGAAFNHALYPHIDADLATIFYRRAQGVNFWGLLKPLLLVRSGPRGSNTNGICQDFLSFACSIAHLFPDETLAQADQYFECVISLLRGNDSLCAHFWSIQRRDPRFRSLLDYARASYPANPKFLPELLGALVGTQQAHRVVRYFSSLVSLTQKYSALVSQGVDSILDPTCDISILEVKEPLQLHPNARQTVFTIPKETRGVLSAQHPDGNKFAIWSVTYNGWDLLLYLMDNLLCEVDPLAPEHIDTLYSIQSGLGLLLDLLTVSPGQIFDLYSSNDGHYNKTSDLHLVDLLIRLCNFFIFIRDPPKKIFAYALTLLSILFPLYPVVIGTFLNPLSLFFNTSTLEYPNLAQMILNNKARPDALPVVLACLDLSTSCISYLLDKLSFHRQIYCRSEPIPQFSFATLRMVLVEVYPHFLSWCYLVPEQRYRIGISCFDLFILALEASDSDLPVLQDLTNLITECFFQQDNAYMLTPLSSIITIGRDMIDRYEASGQMHQATLISELLCKALQLLTLLLKNKFTFTKSPDIANNWIMTMLQDRDGYSCDLVHYIIKLATTTQSQLIAQSATEVVSLLVALASKNKLASKKLNLTFSSLSRDFGEEIFAILSSEMSTLSYKQSVWNLLSCLANSHSHYLTCLLGMATSKTPPLLLDLIEITLKKSMSIGAQAAEDMSGFFCFLKHLWKNYRHYKFLEEKIAHPFQFWNLAKGILDLVSNSNPHLAAIQANICELVGYEIQHLTEDIQTAPAKFQDLVSSIGLKLPTILRKGLTLKPRPASLQMLNRVAMHRGISIASMEACVKSPGCRDFGMYSLDGFGIDADKITRALRFTHYGQLQPSQAILNCIDLANKDIINAHVHRQLFHEQSKLVALMLSSPVGAAFTDHIGVVVCLKRLIQSLVDLQGSLPPPRNNLVGIANLAQLMGEVSQVIYFTREHFRSTESALLLMQLFKALLACQSWVNYDMSHEASALKMVHHIKMGWYQAISGILMTLGSLKPFWVDEINSYHRSFELAAEISANELLFFLPSIDSPMLSVSAKIIDMLVSLFQVQVLPTTDVWVQTFLRGNIPDTLLQLFIRFVTIDRLETILFSHSVIQLLAYISVSPSIGNSLKESQVVAKVTALVAQLQLASRILETESPCAISQVQVFMAGLDLCTQLYQSADMGDEDSRQELSYQTDELLSACAPFISGIFSSVLYSTQLGFTQLQCVRVVVRFITSLNSNALPALAYSHWQTIVEKLSPLMSCMVDTRLLPGALAKRVANPIPIEEQLALRFAMVRVNADSLSLHFVDIIILHLIEFFNAHWQSPQILNTNLADDAQVLMLAVNSYNKFAQPVSFGTLIECISIYTPILDWIAQSMEQYFPPDNSKKVPIELVARADVVTSLLGQSLLLLLAQTHLLLVSRTHPASLKSHLIYDLQQELSPRSNASIPLLKKLVAWFPRLSSTEHSPLGSALEKLICYWTKAHRHILTGSYQHLSS